MVVSDDHRSPVLDVTLNAPLTLDPKGRVTLPTRIASVLKERSLIWTPFEDHLWGFLPTTWTGTVVAPLMAEDSWSPGVADKQRRRLGHATELFVDEHGRFVLTPKLKELAGLSRDCVIVSIVDRLELWDAARWQAWWDRE